MLRRGLAIFFHLRVDAAISALLLVLILAAAVSVRLPWDVLVLVFAGSWTLYLMDAEVHVSPEDRLGNSKRFVFFRQHAVRMQWLRRFLIALCCGLCVLEPVAFWRVKWQGLTVILLCALYVSPALPFLKVQRKLKMVTPLKTLIIPFAWVMGAVVAVRAFGPDFSVLWHRMIGWPVLLFCFLLLDTLVLDWIDLPSDQIAGVKTFPSTFPKISVWLFGVMLALLIVLLFLKLEQGNAVFLSVVSIGLIYPLKNRLQASAARRWVEVLRLVWLVALLMALELSSGNLPMN